MWRSQALDLIQVCSSLAKYQALLLIDTGNVPSSPTAGASTAPTEQIITPASNPIEPTSNNAAKFQLMQTQALAIRALASRATASGNPLTPQTMAHLMQAVKSGTLDYNSPGLQQIKNLLALQAQQKQGQASMNPGVAAAQASGQGQNQGADQVILAAMRQQMLQQNQANGNNHNNNNNDLQTINQQRPAQLPQPTQQQPTHQQQQTQPAPPTQVQQRPAANRERSQSQSQTRAQANTPIWSGELIWHHGSAAKCTSTSGPARCSEDVELTMVVTVAIDAMPIGPSVTSEYHAQFWPKGKLPRHPSDRCMVLMK